MNPQLLILYIMIGLLLVIWTFFGWFLLDRRNVVFVWDPAGPRLRKKRVGGNAKTATFPARGRLPERTFTLSGVRGADTMRGKAYLFHGGTGQAFEPGPEGWTPLPPSRVAVFMKQQFSTRINEGSSLDPQKIALIGLLALALMLGALLYLIYQVQSLSGGV